jgi:hypothetical protein
MKTSSSLFGWCDPVRHIYQHEFVVSPKNLYKVEIAYI